MWIAMPEMIANSALHVPNLSFHTIKCFRAKVFQKRQDESLPKGTIWVMNSQRRKYVRICYIFDESGELDN